jgi:hypothetical protein
MNRYTFAPCIVLVSLALSACEPVVAAGPSEPPGGAGPSEPPGAKPDGAAVQGVAMRWGDHPAFDGDVAHADALGIFLGAPAIPTCAELIPPVPCGGWQVVLWLPPERTKPGVIDLGDVWASVVTTMDGPAGLHGAECGGGGEDLSNALLEIVSVDAQALDLEFAGTQSWYSSLEADGSTHIVPGLLAIDGSYHVPRCH